MLLTFLEWVIKIGALSATVLVLSSLLVWTIFYSATAGSLAARRLYVLQLLKGDPSHKPNQGA